MKAQIVERRRLVIRFFGICVVLLGLLVLWGCSSHVPTDPRAERSAESKNIPLLPMDVAVTGAATPAMDYSAQDVWFLSNEKGEYKVTDREQIYPPTFVRGVEDTFAIMQEGNLLLVNRNGETVASLPSGMDSWGMLRGTRSEDGRYVATLAYSDDADAALVLSDGQQAKAQPHPLEVGGMYISNDGTVFYCHSNHEIRLVGPALGGRLVVGQNPKEVRTHVPTRYSPADPQATREGLGRLQHQPRPRQDS